MKDSVWLVYTDLIHHIIVPFTTWCLVALVFYFLHILIYRGSQQTFRFMPLFAFFTLNSNWTLLHFCVWVPMLALCARHKHFPVSASAGSLDFRESRVPARRFQRCLTHSPPHCPLPQMCFLTWERNLGIEAITANQGPETSWHGEQVKLEIRDSVPEKCLHNRFNSALTLISILVVTQQMCMTAYEVLGTVLKIQRPWTCFRASL